MGDTAGEGNVVVLEDTVGFDEDNIEAVCSVDVWSLKAEGLTLFIVKTGCNPDDPGMAGAFKLLVAIIVFKPVSTHSTNNKQSV